ncbi:MAG: AAA family ATPase, partial [Firmicutes bacterium]|nr:AAA family ATPase [Bacillota bacterium]
MMSSAPVPPAFAIGTAGAPLSLRSYLSPTGMSTPLFLTLAVGIVKAVLPLHSAFHVHAAIKPDHILVDPVTQDVTLIGQRPRTSELSLDLGLFPYMAPEQTGMMRRVIDHRSDIYGLGILFYEMLFGRLPFRAQEPIEWVHAHVAAPPDGRDAAQVPDALWAIVAKCLEKLPEYRYQSTYGLLQDLLRVRDANGGLALAAFRPGEQDVPNALRVSRKVYGRHADARELADLYEGLEADQGGLVLVTGEPGVGKSTLVRHVLDEHLTRGGLIGTGGCEAGQEATPFGPVTALLRSLVRKRLTEPDAVVVEWLEQVREIVSTCPELLVLLPELG